MRFTRGDLPGMLIAALAPPALMILFLASYQVWGHTGTPLLGFMAGNFAIGAGVAAVFSRFIRRWGVPVGLLLALGAVIVAVNVMQRSGHDGSAPATALKWAGVIDFLLLNVALGYQVLSNGLFPVLDRRAARRAAAAEQSAA